ncbi:MAG: alpha/beta hydrolase-fold protein, partial [bacterium]|nr:alpha/beta hydrolase-fold protein [bacterium]
WAIPGMTPMRSCSDLIVVIPGIAHVWHVNWVQSGGEEKNDWEDYITKDLIGFVDGHYRTVASGEGRAIDGFSMGGYGALTLGFLHPDLFCSVNSHSGALRFMDRLRAHLNSENHLPYSTSPHMPTSSVAALASRPIFPSKGKFQGAASG